MSIETAVKYRITRTDDDTEPKWPAFVLGAADDASLDALQVYRDALVARGAKPDYIAQVDERIATFTAWRAENEAELDLPAPWTPKPKKGNKPGK